MSRGAGKTGAINAVRLRRMQALAQIKADAELARLAATGQSRARLRAALAALGQAEPPLGQLAGGVSARMAGDEATPGLESAPLPDPAPTPDTMPVPGPEPMPLDPALVRARLAHAGWITARRRELNARLAMIEADWLRMQPVAARAFGRARVLERLHDQAVSRRAGFRQDPG